MEEKSSVLLFFFSDPNLKQFFPSCFCVLSSSGNMLSPLREITQTGHFRGDESDRESWDLNEWENTNDDLRLLESLSLSPSASG